jgi:hypothetical protein
MHQREADSSFTAMLPRSANKYLSAHGLVPPYTLTLEIMVSSSKRGCHLLKKGVKRLLAGMKLKKRTPKPLF